MSAPLKHKMKTCNNCKKRSTFNMIINGKRYSYPWCTELSGYIKDDCYIITCNHNKTAKREYNDIVQNVFRRFWRWITLQPKEIVL